MVIDVSINIARIANAVQCHSWLSDNKDCHDFRFSIVRIVISVTSLRIVFVAVVNNCHNCHKRHRNPRENPREIREKS